MAAEDVRSDTVRCNSDSIEVGGGGGGGIVCGRSKRRGSLRCGAVIGNECDFELLPIVTLSKGCSSITDGGVRVLVDVNDDVVDKIDLTL